ncbi:MAG: hypothetical protein KHX03_10260 [Clostridium sp.]|nr:hypothetical protein [Clostridium sp.]
MKFNLIEKTVFSVIGVIYLFCWVRDYTISNDLFVTGIYGFIIGLPLVFLVGLYLLIKNVVCCHRTNAKPVHNELANVFSSDSLQKNGNSLIKKFSKCGYLTFGFVFGGIILFAFIQKLFLLGILFVPLLLVVWLAAFVCAVFPIGMWIHSLLSAPLNCQSNENIRFSNDEAWGIIAYFVGLITFVLVLYNFFFNK